MTTKYYDVCNDYSLDLADHEPKESLYTWRKATLHGVEIEIGTHTAYDEIHYVKSDTNQDLNGWRL